MFLYKELPEVIKCFYIQTSLALHFYHCLKELLWRFLLLHACYFSSQLQSRLFYSNNSRRKEALPKFGIHFLSLLSKPHVRRTVFWYILLS